MINILKEQGILTTDLAIHCNAKRIIGNNSEIRTLILDSTSFLEYDADISVRIKCILLGINYQPRCKECNNYVKMRISGRNRNTFPTFCSQKCSNSNDNVKNKRKTTCIEKYGVDNPTKTLDIQTKIKQTHLTKYGVNHSSQLDLVKRKLQQTNLKKYGVDNPLRSKQIRNQIKQTNLEKYGVEYPLQSDVVKNKMKQTNLKKYNVPWTTLNESVQLKARNTISDKYGVDCIFKSKSFREYCKQVHIERYGVEHPTQSPIIREKIKHNNIKRYGVCNPSQRHMIDILPLLEDFDWLYDQYITQNKQTSQLASELNIGHTAILKYLHFHEIQIRQYTTYSYKCIQWLESIMKTNSIHIQHALNGGEYQIPGTRYKADGYCTETNTVYEFYGDYWHGNPKVYGSDIINETIQCTMGELYQKTIEKEERIKELGYNLIVKWEMNFSENDI